MNLMEVLNWLFVTSLKGSVIVALIMLIKVAMKRKLSPALHYYIWIILLIKLIIPYGPQSPVSIYNVFNSPYIPVTAEQNISAVPQNISVQEPQNSPSAVSSNIGANSSNNVSEAVLSGESSAWNKVVNTLSVYQSTFFKLWSIGILFGIMYLLTGIIRMRHIIDNSIKCDRKSEKIIEDSRVELGLKTKVSIAITDRVGSPSLYGYFNPTILLPKDILETLSEEELRYVVIHELCHVKRKDILFSWTIAVLKTLYWFNPVVVFGLNTMKKDCELSCDSAALSFLDKGENLAYGNTIINILKMVNKNTWLPGTTSIVMKKSDLKRRIAMIAGYKKITAKKLILGFAVIFLAGIIGLTGGLTKADVYQNLNGSSQSLSALTPQAKEKIVALSNMYGEKNCTIAYVHPDTTEVNNEKMYLVKITGDFHNGDLKASAISFSILANGSQIWSLLATNSNGNSNVGDTAWEVIDHDVIITDPASAQNEDAVNYVPDYKNVALQTNSKDLKEIANIIMGKYLALFSQNNVDISLRTKGFDIDKISDIIGNTEKFSFSVQYSLKPADIKSYILAGNGEIQGSWVINKFAFVDVEKDGDSYIIKSIGTGR